MPLSLQCIGQKILLVYGTIKVSNKFSLRKSFRDYSFHIQTKKASLVYLFLLASFDTKSMSNDRKDCLHERIGN